MIKTRRAGVVLTFAAGLFAVASVLFAGVAAAQTGPQVNCPAGARGGAGGNGGTSTGTQGGLALNVPVLSSGTGSATAGGGSGGSARGGSGGRGGAGNLPVCNQNTNGGAVAGTTARSAAAPAARAGGPSYGAGGPSYGAGGPLARTGARTTAEIGLAGLALVLGGVMLFFGQPLRRARAKA